MKKYFSLLLIVCTSMVLYGNSQSRLSQFFVDADAFFKKHVENGKVKYSNLKLDHTDLNQLATTIATVNLAHASDNEKKAFFINAYNILVIKAIIKYYPLEKPLDVDGFFDKKRHQIADEFMTLNDIENKHIRKPFQDARIHFALVCGAKGCPPIVNFAYHPALLDEQLQEQTIKALNDEDFVRVKENSKAVYVSEIFDWYSEDFLEESGSILQYINRYRKEGNKLNTRWDQFFYPYDWHLNSYN